MDEKGSPPPYPGTGSSPGAGYSTNYQPEYSNQGYQNSGAHPAYMQAPPNQPFISQQQQQQQQMMSNTVVVGGMGGGMGAPVYQPLPADYTTQAWLACLCCFWPTGLLAIMKASESRDALARGDVMGAHTAANSARQMVRISYIIGLISIILSVVIFGVYFGLIVTQYNNNSD